jgi:RimJ/RimL family protein N-acetyltransferase
VRAAADPQHGPGWQDARSLVRDLSKLVIGELRTERLMLDPLEPSMALEMVDVLADPDLYRYTGGAPPCLADLRRRYDRQAAGWSDDRSERWLNWIIRRTDTNVAAGYLQATVSRSDWAADLAWVVGKPHQGHGFATEAAQAVVGWLAHHGVTRVTAHIGPANRASQAVAGKIGLVPSSKRVCGETVWVLAL